MEVSCEAEGADQKTCSPQPAQLVERMNLRISLWPCDPEPFWAEWWVGRFDATALPLTIYFDFVKAYDYGYVTKGFTLRWIDEFDHLNTTRWEIGAHTFDVNYAHFTPDNAVIVKSEDHDPTSDGSYLALSMTEKGRKVNPSPPSSSIPHDELNVLPVTQVYNDWDPPAKTYLLEGKVCETVGVMNAPGKRYSGGFGSFTTEIADESDSLQKCAAMCVEHYNSSVCRFFSVFSANSTLYCSGFHAPEREIDDPTAMSGVVCSSAHRPEVATTPAPMAESEPEEDEPLLLLEGEEEDTDETATRQLQTDASTDASGHIGETATKMFSSAAKEAADMTEMALDQEAATEVEEAHMPIWIILAVTVAAVLAVATFGLFVPPCVKKRRAETKAGAVEKACINTFTPQSVTSRV
ncbi:unnamed protein product [Vitrella brassicaformis CCMP3155]|uniref:Uncharacterized protein n=1 Tax=Vitrella brassicaformis (strain CCMP3155) TaxID=1169540 RepID=A0A0G4EDP6_VITBC|nr:unnamed protein product [Vitrella brassicaformis CCMP3155]|eukprot:CEL94060.1 unnamed protein product [Vitrella brassicaformis CCMP3155]